MRRPGHALWAFEYPFLTIRRPYGLRYASIRRPLLAVSSEPPSVAGGSKNDSFPAVDAWFTARLVGSADGERVCEVGSGDRTFTSTYRTGA